MNNLPAHCPICKDEITVTRFYCRSCDTNVEGRFQSKTPFSQLNREQLAFVELFVRNEGRINRMENELGLSYPTIRNRLHDVIRALGYEPGGEDLAGISEDKRQRILEDLDQGKISAEEAMRILRESEG
jgi:hypothetical protein